MNRTFRQTTIILASVFGLTVCNGIAILESTCTMNIEFVGKKNLTLETYVAIEKETTTYLSDRIALLESKGALNDVTPLILHVSVQNAKRSTSGNLTTSLVNSIVSMIYQSSQDKPLLLEQVMDLALLQGFETFNFSFATTTKSIIFDPRENDTTVLRAMDDDNLDSSSSINRALVWATSILSVMLVVVSIVLLTVTGGLESCKSFCMDCLFEEVDDDYEISNKNTMLANSGADDEEEVEHQSIATASPAPTTASGYLGAQVQSNLLAGLGVKTPGQQEGESVMSYDDYDDVGITPRSEVSNSLPLGITSIRKMPEPGTPDAQRSLTGIIMQRFAGNPGQKL